MTATPASPTGPAGKCHCSGPCPAAAGLAGRASGAIAVTVRLPVACRGSDLPAPRHGPELLVGAQRNHAHAATERGPLSMPVPALLSREWPPMTRAVVVAPDAPARAFDSPGVDSMEYASATTGGLAATLKAEGEGFAYRSTAQVAGTLDLNDAAASSPIELPARTRRPSARPSPSPTTRYSPAPNRLELQHASSSAHCRPSSPLTAPAAADARSVLLRFSVVSCVIFKRLGASDAAASSPI